jgi:hypothetical protein
MTLSDLIAEHRGDVRMTKLKLCPCRKCAAKRQEKAA